MNDQEEPNSTPVSSTDQSISSQLYSTKPTISRKRQRYYNLIDSDDTDLHEFISTYQPTLEQQRIIV